MSTFFCLECGQGQGDRCQLRPELSLHECAVKAERRFSIALAAFFGLALFVPITVVVYEVVR